MPRRLCIPEADVREARWGKGCVQIGEGAELDAIRRRKWRPVRAYMGSLTRETVQHATAAPHLHFRGASPRHY